MTDNYVKFISEQQKLLAIRGLAEAAENYTHELDATHAKGMVAHLKKHGFHAKIHKAAGPAGGASVVRLGHPDGEKHVHSYIKQYYDDDHSKRDDMYKITNVSVNEDLEFESEEFDDIVEAVIDVFIEEIEDLQELSPELKSKYLHKAVANIQRRGIRSGRTGEKDPKIAKRVKGVAKAGGSEDQAKDTAKYAKSYGKQASKPMPNNDDKWDDEYQKRDITHTYMRASARAAKKTT